MWRFANGKACFVKLPPKLVRLIIWVPWTQWNSLWEFEISICCSKKFSARANCKSSSQSVPLDSVSCVRKAFRDSQLSVKSEFENGELNFLFESDSQRIIRCLQRRRWIWPQSDERISLEHFNSGGFNESVRESKRFMFEFRASLKLRVLGSVACNSTNCLTSHLEDEINHWQ